jgi:hypothetical protein
VRKPIGESLGGLLGEDVGLRVGLALCAQTAMMLKLSIPTALSEKPTCNRPAAYQLEGITSDT